MTISTAGAMPVAFLSMLVRALRDHDESWPTSLDRDDFTPEEQKSRDSLRQRWEDNRAIYATDVKNAAQRLGLEVDERGYPKDSERLLPEPGELSGVGDSSSLGAMLAKLESVFDVIAKKTAQDMEAQRAMREDGTMRFRQIVPVVDANGVLDGMFALDMEGTLHFSPVTRASLESVPAAHGDEWNLVWTRVESRL